MMFELSQKFYFEAAHTLQRTIDAEGSRRIHGHTYHAEATVSGRPDPHTGMVLDLGHFRSAIEAVRAKLDHQFLDEIAELGPATLENLCAYIFAELSKSVARVVTVSIERPATGDRCTYRP
ncbi:MAG TPA: 6-carboxytetrahydropterin synthase [Albitalea sp.]|uniref:6-carboxytetrahydropterin synthase n=1 Tax=Piscinibacter sp. TaxID=1903157 RepID=UPI002ED6A131